MPRLTPVSHRELIERLTALGFDGPYSGGRHEFMLRQELSDCLHLPSQFRSTGLLSGQAHSFWPDPPLNFQATTSTPVL
jgi:hypothetical protein